MKFFAALLFCLIVTRMASAQDPVEPIMWDTTTASLGIGSTIFPTPVLATMRLGDGGGGIIGGNVTVNGKVSKEIAKHIRIPFSFSIGFMRGNEQYWHRDAIALGDTVTNSRILTNSSNLITAQLGIEYFEHHELVSPYVGVDFSFSNIGVTTEDFTIPAENNKSLLHQQIPAASRFGITLRAGAEFPIYNQLYYDVSAELGALNLFGRPTSNDSTNTQLFVPTEISREDYTARAAEGKSGEAIITYFRLLVKLAWKF